MTRATTVLIGIGNPMRRDDGIGPAVIDACERQPIAGCDLVQLDGEATRLIEAWSGRRLAVIVDAVCAGAAPGTIHDLGVDRLGEISTVGSMASSHHAGLAEAIALGRALERLPDVVRVLGIEPADLDHGLGLSPPVAASLDTLVGLVRSALLVDPEGLLHLGVAGL